MFDFIYVQFEYEQLSNIAINQLWNKFIIIKFVFVKLDTKTKLNITKMNCWNKLNNSSPTSHCF